jgi:hypothetical protein
MNPPTDSMPEKRSCKSPWLAALLSLLLPGSGQIYCRQDNKGVFLIGMSLLGQWSTGGMSSWILCPVMALDAFMIARKLNGGGVIQRWEFFPGIKALNFLPTRIILLAVAALVAALTVVHIVHFAADYNLPAK